MAPRSLADECVYQETIEFLRNLGCDVMRAQGLGLRGAPDREVFRKAQERDLAGSLFIVDRHKRKRTRA